MISINFDDALPFDLTLQEFLPTAVHGAFELLAIEFVLLPWKEAQAATIAGASQGGSQVCCEKCQQEIVLIID